jgi:hypothetical protein
MENLAHQPNNAKNKGKNQNNNNPGLGGNNPQQNQPVGGNQKQGKQNPQEDNNNNLQKKFHCTLCSEHFHYTHHFPQIFEFKWMKDPMNIPRPSTSPSPQQAPQQYLQQPPLVVFQNPIPHKGVMNTE